MTRRYPLLILATVAVLVLGAYIDLMVFRITGLPFDANVVDARTAVVTPHPGVPLPPDLLQGDRIDLLALDQAARVAVYRNSPLPLGHTYGIALRRGGTVVTVPVTTVDRSHSSGEEWIEWPSVFQSVLLTCIALLLFWRGRDRAASGFALWVIANLVVYSSQIMPADGVLGVAAGTTTAFSLLAARVGFFIMIDALVGARQTAGMRLAYRGSFALLLLAGAVLVMPLPQYIYLLTGWAGLLPQDWGLVLVASYFPPLVMLAAGYARTDDAHRQRLRWMLWSAVLWMSSILVLDASLLGYQASYAFASVGNFLALLGFLYAVLRHRVMDISVVIDRTLVYGSVTALVVGTLAAVNSLVEHAALGVGANLFLQVLVPLSLGIVLTRVRAWLDRVVEQVFFRKKYRADRSLRRFARHAVEYGRADEMMQAAMLEIYERLGVPGVAVYESRSEGYRRVCQVGQHSYPEHIKANDAAFVAVRADRKDIDLAEFRSGLGTEGHVFPVTGFGAMQGVIVCTNRPGEHYASDERKLLAYLAHHLGMALHIIDARQSREFVRAVARGEIKPQSVKEHAQTIELGWAVS